MPSSVTCVHVGRPPLIAVVVRLTMPGTPACRRISSIGFRPSSGRSVICRWTTVCDTSGDVVCTGERSALTVTVSVTAPTSSRAVSDRSTPTLISTCVNSAVLNPASAIVTE